MNNTKHTQLDNREINQEHPPIHLSLVKKNIVFFLFKFEIWNYSRFSRINCDRDCIARKINIGVEKEIRLG